MTGRASRSYVRPGSHKTADVTFSCTPAERAQMGAAAKRAGVTRSEWIRRVVMVAVRYAEREDERPAIVMMPMTGIPQRATGGSDGDK